MLASTGILDLSLNRCLTSKHTQKSAKDWGHGLLHSSENLEQKG